MKCRRSSQDGAYSLCIGHSTISGVCHLHCTSTYAAMWPGSHNYLRCFNSLKAHEGFNSLKAHEGFNSLKTHEGFNSLKAHEGSNSLKAHEGFNSLKAHEGVSKWEVSDNEQTSQRNWHGHYFTWARSAQRETVICMIGSLLGTVNHFLKAHWFVYHSKCWCLHQGICVRSTICRSCCACLFLIDILYFDSYKLQKLHG